MRSFWWWHVFGEVPNDVASWGVVCDDDDFAPGFGEGYAQILRILPYYLKLNIERY